MQTQWKLFPARANVRRNVKSADRYLAQVRGQVLPFAAKRQDLTPWFCVVLWASPAS